MAGYGGMGGVSPVLASVLAQPFQAAALRPGQVLQGIVQSTEPQLLIRFGGLVIPVEKVQALRAGEAVSAEVVRTDRGLQLRITPSAAGLAQQAGNNAAGASARSLPDIIVNALQALGKLERAEQAVALVPRAAAESPAAVRLVLSLLLDRADGRDDARRVAQILQRALDEGALGDDDVRGLLLAVRATIADDAKDMAPFLRRAADAAQRPLAARMAESLAKGDVAHVRAAFSDDVPAALARLADHDAFDTFLHRTGQFAEYRRAVEQLADRSAAAQLVNARGADAPYLFFALPTPADSPIRHAHLHVMGEGGGKAQRFDAKHATAVLDLSTTELGDLWITLAAAGGACSCWIRARELDTVALLQSHADELAARLANAGYSGASVQTALWDGDRVRELAAMMRRFKGLDVDA